MIDTRLLRVIVRWFLRVLRPDANVDLNICLVNSPEITRLNETFLRHSGPTDVITFDYSEPGFSKNAAQPLHGEIFVCIDEAFAQARRFRAPWQCELVRYIIHGILHLSGYDDQRSVARRKMKHAENQWLRRVGAEFSLPHIGKVTRTRTRTKMKRKIDEGC